MLKGVRAKVVIALAKILGVPIRVRSTFIGEPLGQSNPPHDG
jgi:hypothetical protein